MQELIIENLVKWFSKLNFSFSRNEGKISFVCKELNIKIENLEQDAFYEVFLEQFVCGIEKLFNLKVLGIDLRELFGVKKAEIKTEAKPEKITEDWIKQELEKAFKQGKLNSNNPNKDTIQDLFQQWQTQRYLFPDYMLGSDRIKTPWEQVICFRK